MILVDTNILIYALNQEAPFHSKCAAWLTEQRRQSGAWFTTWPILYEFLRVTTHPRVMRAPLTVAQSWQLVVDLLSSPGLSVLVASDRHTDVAQRVFQDVPGISGSVFHDAHTAILMREHGVTRICTIDADFRRFPFLQVVDPTQ